MQPKDALLSNRSQAATDSPNTKESPKKNNMADENSLKKKSLSLRPSKNRTLEDHHANLYTPVFKEKHTYLNVSTDSLDDHSSKKSSSIIGYHGKGIGINNSGLKIVMCDLTSADEESKRHTSSRKSESKAPTKELVVDKKQLSGCLKKTATLRKKKLSESDLSEETSEFGSDHGSNDSHGSSVSRFDVRIRDS